MRNRFRLYGLYRWSLVPGLPFVLLALVPSIAYGHTGIGPAAGFLHGFAHPLVGADHLLAMVAVGLWAAQQGGRGLWLIPATFVGTMIVGGALGMADAALPGVEGVIMASVLLLGAVVALAARLPLGPAVAVVASVALFHGHAHGAEMPAAASAAAYAMGFALATSLLHATGVFMALAAVRGRLGLARAQRGRLGLARAANRTHVDHGPAPGAAWVRAGGAAIVLSGLALLLA